MSFVQNIQNVSHTQTHTHTDLELSLLLPHLRYDQLVLFSFPIQNVQLVPQFRLFKPTQTKFTR